MLSIPGTEALSPAVKYVIAFAIIFVLLALFALVLRRVTGGRLSIPANDRRSRQPRLGIVDVYDLDRQRQLILLRRDNVEHLLLIGGPNDVIVETNIVRTPGGRLAPSPVEQNDRPETLIDRSFETPSRPLVEPVQRPEPVVARLGQTDPTRAGAEQVFRNGAGAIPAEPILKPDVVALSAAAPAVPPQPSPQPAREAPPPVQAMREPAPPQAMREPPPPQPVRAPPPQPVREVPPPQPAPPRATPAPAKAAPPPREAPPPPAAAIARPAPESPRQPAPPPSPPRSPDPALADAAVLSNMAKQLEEALKRPLSTENPSPASAANGLARQAEGFAKQAVERPSRVAQAPPARVPQPAAPASIPMAPASLSARAVEEPPAQRPRPAPAPVARMRPAPEPAPAEARPAPPPPEPAPAGPSEPGDPFSVEEIEAEFARLLGRPLDRSDRPH